MLYRMKYGLFLALTLGAIKLFLSRDPCVTQEYIDREAWANRLDARVVALVYERRGVKTCVR